MPVYSMGVFFGFSLLHGCLDHLRLPRLVTIRPSMSSSSVVSVAIATDDEPRSVDVGSPHRDNATVKK